MRKGKRGGQGKFGVEDQLLIAMAYSLLSKTALQEIRLIGGECSNLISLG
ncbi:hypothetical protein Q2T42_18795 [Leptolyngbya boryana CZ1]|uniref:Uncharacterized protein n=2 Tax=Leptolyngbya TaxID=47251 RepID=A0AA96WQY1_LEPBY|nr:hypothetical protein [Leptolyngbya boryana]WNZ43888.1 hypothetical protein Q2T42_18795 [Leptolyngbya boryana CZ1]